MTSDAATALFTAIHANNLEGVHILVQAEPELLTAVSPSGLSPVLFAAYYQRPAILQHLIAAGAPLNIFEAAAAGEGERVRELLADHPLLVNSVSPDGFSPLGLAAFFGREDVASQLLAQGADVNAVSQNAMGVQPLHSAVAGNHARLAEALIEAGANVNATQHGGFTPLMGAAQNGNAELVAFLLERGADATARTEDGRSAYALAAEENHESVLKLLPAEADQPEGTQNAKIVVLGHTEGMTNSDDPNTETAMSQYDHLATRNVEAMETALQAPEFEGSDSVAPLGVGAEMLDAVVPGAGLGTDMSVAVIDQHIRSVADQNPNYTPPSQMTPPHLAERAAGLPEGDGAELEAEVRTNFPEK